jgi:LysR family transcriptional regulator, nitrogen assimilation regulatory protein
MELRQLQYFLVIAEQKSISRASAQLTVAQPALSRSIRELEKDLGTQLLFRHGRGIGLTEAGDRFYNDIRPLVQSLLQAKQNAAATNNQISGPIALGLPPSLSATIGASLIQSFLEEYPQVKLHIMGAFSGFINEWLVTGRVDMAVINRARQSPHIHMDPLLIVDLFHIQHRNVEGFNNAETISFEEICNMPMALPGRHHGLRRQIESVARLHGKELNVVVEIDDLQALKELVYTRNLSSILPYGTIVREASDPDIAVRRIQPEISMEFMIAYSLQRPMTLAMRELTRVLKLTVRNAIASGRIKGREY